MYRQKHSFAAFAFIVSGMVELLGFLPYVLSLLRSVRMRLYKTLPVAILAALSTAFYLPEATQILQLLLGFAGFNIINNALSEPGRFSLFGNFSQLSIISQFKPLLLSETIILGAAIVDTYRQKMSVERMVLYVATSSIFVVLFASLIAF